MTDEELKELVASNSRTIARLEALQEENGRRWQENEHRWQEMREEIYASRLETDRLVRKIHQDMGRLSRKLGDLPRVCAGRRSSASCASASV